MEKSAELLKLFLECRAVCTDTRMIIKSSIFFALKGDNFNGNEFAHKALEMGCVAAVVDEEIDSPAAGIIHVDSVLLALQRLAKDYRNTLNIPVIGITGTNGKTTTKELMSVVLNSHVKCYSTKGNLNNHIGVPLSVLSITDKHDMAIIEMGANKLEDITELTDICRPNYGVITNVGKAHLEGFGSFQNIMKTKKELYDFLGSNDGLTFINKDNSFLGEMAKGLKKVSYYSLNTNSEVKGEITKSDVILRFRWTTHEFTSPEICTQLTGEYNLENAMAAVAVGVHFKVPNSKIVEALENYSPSNNRSQIKQTEKNTLILDAYNANITSTRAALKNLDLVETDLEKFFILGDMLELGETSQKEHEDIMALTRQLDMLGIFVGSEYKKADGANMYAVFDNSAELRDYLDHKTIKGKLILIKGSRGIKLEVLEEKL
ncbi:MAG: UDP-N-acetylmuramoyl-tripeptide--D-alanyl-D-alanine ligase [Flavobacteriales bacterium]